MIRLLLLSAAVLAVSTAAGVDYKTFMSGCSCSSYDTTDGVKAFVNTSTPITGYCPITTMKSCDPTMLQEGPQCTITCQTTDPRTFLGYRYGSGLTFGRTSSISCSEGKWMNAENVEISSVEFRNPTCIQKFPCNQCSAIQLETSCPSGMSCNPTNYQLVQQPDGCTRAFCAEGALKLYSASTHLPYTNFTFNKQLYCTKSGSWANYSIDGDNQAAAATLFATVTANCVLPKACENCAAPTLLTDLTQLPAPFRTGYTIITPIYYKQSMSCSKVSCPVGYTLYGFNSTSATATGLEYTNYGPLMCSDGAVWKNGGLITVPANLQTACLAPIPITTTTTTTTTTTPATTTTTTPSPCGTWDPLGPANTVGGGSVHCQGTQAIVDCAGKKIQMITSANTSEFEKMCFVTGKGWLGFDCSGNANLYKAGGPMIQGVQCI